MTALMSVTFSTRLLAGVALACSALFAGHAAAEIYQCKQKNGKVELRDFPCEGSNRPPAPVQQQSLPSTTGQSRASAPSYASSRGFATNAQYEAARNLCMRLMSQNNFTAPMLRCDLNDVNCFRRANQESNAIFLRLIALPEWKRQECDLVMQIEGAASNADQKNFEVVGSVRGCKYFVAEQASSYSLVEEWLCFRPSRGDAGFGDIGTYGLKEVKLNGMTCTVYVDDWALGRSRAAEKLRDKCR